MSDPVDTDALRLAGKRADYYQTGEGPLWCAAAAEVDRLRAERDSWQRRAGDLYDEWDQQSHVANGLRAVIENAPHDSLCNYRVDAIGASGTCTCWKADAL